MAKLSESDKRQIVVMRCAGATLDDVAKKFKVSQTAISKILKQQKSLEKVEKVDILNQKVNKSLKDQAHNAIRLIIDGLDVDLTEASVRDKMIVLEKLIDYFGLPEEEQEQVTEIKVVFSDGSGGKKEDEC